MGLIKDMGEQIAVIGAGSWGTALAKLLADKGNDVLIWAYEPNISEGINHRHINPLYFPDLQLPHAIKATNDLGKALAGRKFVVSTVPSKWVRSIWNKGSAHLDPSALLVSGTKGIEAKSLKLMSQVLAECLPKHPAANRAVISGPSFAHEVALGLLTSVVIAGVDPAVCRRIQDAFRTNTFLTFTNEDVTGVEVGGAVKNVIAIATGLADGLSLGHNSRAAIITRGLYEMIKIGKALGASPLTFAGLSGIGDLVLTCTGKLSRNHEVGYELGKGRTLKEITGSMTMVAEGISTSEAVHRLAKIHSINVPICDAIYRILFEGLFPKQAITDLCAMPLREELRTILKEDKT